ncbi:MAG TPA: hypothetical protein VIP77_14950 [Jiangellaceae bacterium]
MRPQRFSDFVIDLAKNSPTVSRVQTLAEVGDTQHPFGLAVTTAMGETRWQFTGQLPDGAKHEGFADEPVAGAPANAAEDPAAAKTPEAWFAALIGHGDSPEIETIERWSTRDQPPSANGVTVRFHNGARVFVRQL